MARRDRKRGSFTTEARRGIEERGRKRRAHGLANMLGHIRKAASLLS
jgi:hypothetical protein